MKLYIILDDLGFLYLATNNEKKAKRRLKKLQIKHLPETFIIKEVIINNI